MKIDLVTILVIAFALCVVVFLSSLPWIIGAVMDRRKKRSPAHTDALVIRQDTFGEERSRSEEEP